MTISLAVAVKKQVWKLTSFLLSLAVFYTWLLGYWLFLGKTNPDSDLMEYPSKNLLPLLLIICIGHAIILASTRLLKEHCPNSICMMAELSILPLLFVWGASMTVFVYGEYLFESTPLINQTLEQTLPYVVSGVFILMLIAHIVAPKEKETSQPP